MAKALVNLATGMEDPETVAIAMLIALGAAETGNETRMFLTREAVRLAVPGIAVGVPCEGSPSLPDLLERYVAAGGRYFVCPLSFNARHLDAGSLIQGAELSGRVPTWTWIGDEGATVFSY